LDLSLPIPAPFNPTNAVTQVAAALREYGLSEVTSDRYAAEWARDAFAQQGITLRYSERDRSQIYMDVLPLFASNRVRLVDDRKMISQFASLERRPSSGGRDKIDHPPHGHDDLCNSAAAALTIAVAGPRIPRLFFAGV